MAPRGENEEAAVELRVSDARTLDLQALRIFKAVADEASITRAAQQLHYVQSNVTTRLRQLEAQLGVPLFRRTSGRLVITPAGVTLRGYAERLLSLAQEARRSVVDDGIARGPLAVGSMETTAAARLPQLLARFAARHPEVELTLETGPTDHLVQGVRDYRLDAALVGGTVDDPALASCPLFDEELVLITARGRGRVRAPRDLGVVTLLTFRSGCSYRRRLEQWLAAGGVNARRTLEFGTFEGIVACVAAGMGVSLMPRVVLERRDLRQSVELHRIGAPHARIRTHLVWRRDATPSRAREAFAAVLRSAVGRTTRQSRA